MAALEVMSGPEIRGGTGPRLVVSRGRRRRDIAPPTTPVVSNARVAVVMLLVAECMFFAGLVGAYLVFRGRSAIWPPPGLPRLPMGVTWANTVVLMASGLTMLAAVRSATHPDRSRLTRRLWMTAGLGAAFVTVQGIEWVRLVHFGLSLSSGTFGSTFYTLIGAHALHVFGAMVWLAALAVGVERGRFVASLPDSVEACGIYWFFVCALWLVLFALVYH